MVPGVTPGHRYFLVDGKGNTMTAAIATASVIVLTAPSDRDVTNPPELYTMSCVVHRATTTTRAIVWTCYVVHQCAIWGLIYKAQREHADDVHYDGNLRWYNVWSFVVNLVAYGAFVEIEGGVEGLVHVSELSWTKRVQKPSDILKVGQEVDAVILNFNKEEQKISLGIRQLETNLWEKVRHNYPVGARVRGKVRNLTNYGAFIELEEGIDGLLHVSDMSWTRKVNQHPQLQAHQGHGQEQPKADV